MWTAMSTRHLPLGINVETRHAPPINMAHGLRSPSFLTSNAQDSSNVSPVSSINKGTTYLGHQSPAVIHSRTAIPFQRAGSYQPAPFVPETSAMLPDSGSSSRGARSGSVANQFATTTVHELSQARISDHSSSVDPQADIRLLRSRQPLQMADLARLHLNPLPASAISLAQSGQDEQSGLRSYLAGMVLRSDPVTRIESSLWRGQLVVEGTPQPAFPYHAGQWEQSALRQ